MLIQKKHWLAGLVFLGLTGTRFITGEPIYAVTVPEGEDEPVSMEIAPLTESSAIDFVLTKDSYIENIGECKYQMVWIPGGPADIDPVTGDKRFIEGYWIGQTEVTVEMFRQFVEDTNYVTRAEEDDHGSWRPGKTSFELISGVTWKDNAMNQSDQHPVCCVTPTDAMIFCEWLSKKTGRRYTLPTELQFEYAARANRNWQDKWFFGNDPTRLMQYAWMVDNAEMRTHPVKTRNPNPWGLYDILGNVSEYCYDYDGTLKIRGGDYADLLETSASYATWWNENHQESKGFRIVRLPEGRNGSAAHDEIDANVQLTGFPLSKKYPLQLTLIERRKDGIHYPVLQEMIHEPNTYLGKIGAGEYKGFLRSRFHEVVPVTDWMKIEPNGNHTFVFKKIDPVEHVYQITTHLEPGEYEYKFYTDPQGFWIADPLNPQRTNNYSLANSAFSVPGGAVDSQGVRSEWPKVNDKTGEVSFQHHVRLLPQSSVFLRGTFNNWKMLPEYKLTVSDTE